MSPQLVRRAAANFIGFVLIPALLYSYIFIQLTYQLVDKIQRDIWTISPDGYQFVWDLWWVNKAITGLHQSPWFNGYVNFPAGTQLWTHALTIFNGLVAIVLMRFMSLVAAFNVLMLFSFVAGGVTAFWLAYYLTKSATASYIAGFIFTFSNYHFAQFLSHLNLVALEWIPLFVLLWYILLNTPNLKVAIGAALALALVLLCEYYYFVYCVLAAILMTGWFALRQRDLLFIVRKEYRMPIGLFTICTVALTGPFIVMILAENLRDPISGHPANLYSADLAALFVPSAIWRFGALTKPFWTDWVRDMSETSIAFAFPALLLAVYTWLKRKAIGYAELGLWFVLLIFFAVMSLGPVLHINAQEYPSLPMPYSLLEFLIPPLSISGVPIRMSMMGVLALSVISAFGFSYLLRGSWWHHGIAVFLFAAIVIMCMPTSLPTTPAQVPKYVLALRDLPGSGAVLDNVEMDAAQGAPLGRLMYFQTIHQKPIAFSYLSRIPRSVAQQNGRIQDLFNEHRLTQLCSDYGIRYIVVKPSFHDGLDAGAKLVYQDKDVKIFELTSPLCRFAAPRTSG